MNQRMAMLRRVGVVAVPVAAIVLVAAGGRHPSQRLTAEEMAARADVMNGRQQVIEHDCNGCHGGLTPASEGWLAGAPDSTFWFKIGPFTTRPRNLTPDNLTGMGRFTERQIFNALRYGLRPGETPDVTITGTTPGEGNFPAQPKYLAVPMPWPAWRHMSDQDLWDMAAYLKRALKPVRHKVEDSDGPPDFWASAYTVDSIGPLGGVPFPARSEQRPQ